MSDWRDDLPPIPADRIRDDAIREGTRRREHRQRRQRTILLGGIGAAAVAVIVVSGVLTRPPADDDDAASAPTAPPATDSPADTAAAVTVSGDASGTEAPADTEAESTEAAAAATTAAAEATTAGTDPVDYTTIGGPGAELPENTDIVVVPAVIWEQPPSGPACGPTTMEVVIPQSLGLTNPVVSWQTADLSGEVPAIVEAGNAHATIGPFGQETLGGEVRYELLVVVAGTDASGVDQAVRAPSAVLIDCP